MTGRRGCRPSAAPFFPLPQGQKASPQRGEVAERSDGRRGFAALILHRQSRESRTGGCKHPPLHVGVDVPDAPGTLQSQEHPAAACGQAALHITFPLDVGRNVVPTETAPAQKGERRLHSLHQFLRRTNQLVKLLLRFFRVGAYLVVALHRVAGGLRGWL